MSEQHRKKKRRWGDAAATTTTTTAKAATSAGGGAIDAKAKALALQSSISARLAALKASKATAAVSSSSSSAVATTKQNGDNNRPVKKAKVYDLDLSITTPQFQKKKEYGKEKKEKEKKKINPYLAHLAVPEQQEQKQKSSSKGKEEQTLTKEQNDGFGGDGGDEILDNRLKGGKNRMTKNRLASKKINFIEPGTYIEKAKKKHLSNLNAIQSGYHSGRKKGTYIEATTIATVDDDNATASKEDYYGANENQDARTLAPRVDAIYTSIDGTTTSSGGTGSTKDTNGVVPIPIPLVMEWWDLPLLSKQFRKEVVSKENELVMEHTKQRLKNPFQGKDKEKNSSSNEKKGDDEDESSTAAKKDGKQSELQALTQKCYITASITNSRTYKLIQHPKPVIPPSMQNQEEKPKPVLHLTKKELKKQRKLRRAEKQREIQDLQAVGLLPKPEPKLTLSNYMRVLGTQAVLDPSTMEKKVQEQIQARRMKHEKANLEESAKAKELRALKKQQEAKEKLSGGTGNSQDPSVSIALFLVKDMSHRYHRTKVDLNAQQWYITGGVLECESNPKLSLVIAEGDAKAIKKYIRLMTVRMKWKGENFIDSQEDEDDQNNDGDVEMDDANGESEKPKQQKFNQNNSCELVWTGMSAKRMFKSFIFQSCPTSDHARKVLEAKGVAHFWDQVLVHASGTGESFNFKLG